MRHGSKKLWDDVKFDVCTLFDFLLLNQLRHTAISNIISVRHPSDAARDNNNNNTIKNAAFVAAAFMCLEINMKKRRRRRMWTQMWLRKRGQLGMPVSCCNSIGGL
ncbi:hypothetical protein XENOCAPTIV_021609 [Xenoophorus captivus]|uniref:Uncharacterized protein n=1 Tax=Xenoophorus captivus TaxID=1517983 RepID=A0ABV0QBZ4_9TELE